MKIFTANFSMLMIVLSVLAFAPHAQSQTGNLSGTVRSCYTNGLLPGVSITCGSVNGITNAGGVYTLNGISPGLQTITATMTGFTAFNAPVTIVANITTTYNFCMAPLPGIITGVVTGCTNGNYEDLVKISWGNYFTYSGAGGAYTLTVYTPGTNTLTATKEGFTPFQQAGVTAICPAPPNTVVNICMQETTPPPSAPFPAVLNSGQTQVDLNWGLPADEMVLGYDDCSQEGFSIWATGSGENMIAVKFTPLSYPAKIKKCYFNIGTALNYPPGSDAFAPTQFDIYNDAGGVPGTPITGTTTTITPAVYGWTEFAFTAPVTLASGNFFIVMTQLGTGTLSPGIATDTTAPQLRSFSKFGSSGTWMPANGNYMIRAVIYGSGGPIMMDDPTIAPANLLGYEVWRLFQGQEATPALWTSVGTTTTTTLTDNSWPGLICGPYLWAAKAQYTGNRWSTATFSNVLGKCWTCNVTVNINTGYDTTAVAGVSVIFHNLGPDTNYSWVMDTSGTHTFTNFWKGTYNLSVSKFGYITYMQNGIAIMGDMTINISLMQFKAPPTNLYVYDTDAVASWNPPILQQVLFNEPFTTGFATNGWVPDGGSHWMISATNGNPGQCAEWAYNPAVTNYSQSLTSQTFTGLQSDILLLKFDVHLNNLGNTTLEQLAAEIYDGTSWHMVIQFDNSTGMDIPYTTACINIASFVNQTSFKIRFRVYGEDSNSIDWWDIDNVELIAQTGPGNPGLLGYDFYLNGALEGQIQDTFYHINPCNLSYGTNYHACVDAIYANGNSTSSCYDFTSHYLSPPINLAGTSNGSTNCLTWDPPTCIGWPYLMGYTIYRNNYMLAVIPGGSTVYYDYNVPPGIFVYSVKARYYINPYNPPSYSGLSRAAGPVSLTAVSGFPLPFIEPWDLWNFNYQNWSFTPNQGNWWISSGAGDPVPCADFSWQPVRNNYDYSLVSPNLDATAWSCGTMYCDFEVSLSDQNATGMEKLDVDVFIDNNWINKAELVNNGSFDWTLKQIDITEVLGKAFKIRFRANGVHSDDIQHWYLDNIHIYGVLPAPIMLTGYQNGFITNLSWITPQCGGGKSPAGSELMGFNVYRTNDNESDLFHRVNTSGPITGITSYSDTTHPDTTAPGVTWKYYVAAVFADSTNPLYILGESPSDTITVTFPAVGINNMTNGSVAVYPNPVGDFLNVVSTKDLKCVEVLNYLGQTVYSMNNLNQKTGILNVAGLKSGVYFVKVTSVNGIKVVKITVQH